MRTLQIQVQVLDLSRMIDFPPGHQTEGDGLDFQRGP